MTATVRPPVDAPFLKHADPEVRAGEYSRALKFYLEHVGEYGSVIFAENSGYDLNRFLDLVPKHSRDKIEWLSVEFQHPAAYGKGYGEFRLMDWVVDRSTMLRKLPANTHAWKVTGRLIVRNIQSYINYTYNGGVVCDVYKRPKWLDLRLYGFSLEGYYKFFHSKYEELREDTGPGSPEHRLYRMLESEFGKGVNPRFLTQPEFWGISGKTGRRYHRGVELWKFWIRRTLRFVCPGLWI